MPNSTNWPGRHFFHPLSLDCYLPHFFGLLKISILLILHKVGLISFGWIYFIFSRLWENFYLILQITVTFCYSFQHKGQVTTDTIKAKHAETAERIKIESILFVPIILTFSKNLRCLNLALTQAQKSVTRHFWWLKKLCIFFILALSKNFWSFLEFFCWQHCSHNGKFKHLKFLENVKIIGTNNIDSILGQFQSQFHF